MADALNAMFAGFVDVASTSLQDELTGGNNSDAAPSPPNPTPQNNGTVDGGTLIPAGSGSATRVSAPFYQHMGLMLGVGAVALLLVVLIVKK